MAEQVKNFSDYDSSILVKSSIDTVKTVDDTIEISGWSFAENMDTTQQKVYLSITGSEGMTNTYTTMRNGRPDVGTAFKNDAYSNSGFYTEIPTQGFKNGEYTIRLYVKVNGKIAASQESVYIINETGIQKKS